MIDQSSSDNIQPHVIASVDSFNDFHMEIYPSPNWQSQSSLILEPLLQHSPLVSHPEDTSIPTVEESSITMGVEGLQNDSSSNHIPPLAQSTIEISNTLPSVVVFTEVPVMVSPMQETSSTDTIVSEVSHRPSVNEWGDPPRTTRSRIIANVIRRQLVAEEARKRESIPTLNSLIQLSPASSSESEMSADKVEYLRSIGAPIESSPITTPTGQYNEPTVLWYPFLPLYIL
jgi:hypothetical protein